MKRIRLLLAVFAAMVGLSVNAQLTNGTVYWLQDVSTGEFLSQGANWGTQATVQGVGGIGFEAVFVSEGVYKLKNIQWNKVNNADLGLRVTDGYCDQAASDLTLTPSGEGYLVGIAGGNYLCNNQAANGYGVKPIGLSTNSADATVWKFLTKSEYDAALQAKKDNQAASIANTLGYSSITTQSAFEALINDANLFISKDYTSSITNAALNAGNTTGWTATKPNQRAQAFGSENGTMAEAWNGCVVANQSVTGLLNGLYKITFVGTFRPKGSTEAQKLTSEQTSSPAYVFANDDKEEFIHWIDVPAKANNRAGVKNNATAYTSTFYTYVTDGTINLGVKQDTWYDGNMWCPFGYFTLTYYTDQVSDEDAAAIIASVPTDKMSDATKAKLDAAKETFESNKSIANYNALTAAISEASVSIAEYATIASGSIPTNNFDGWAKSTSVGDAHVNTWSTEGGSDGSNMTTPFIEDWVASGTALGAGKLYYTFTDLNPGETYVVSALVRAYNESGTGVSGISFFAGDNSKDLDVFGAACTGDYATNGMFATLSCAGTVDTNGQLQFGIEVADASLVNWISIKNVTITAGTGDVPTAIEMSPSTLTLRTASTAQITANIVPSTADDKTLLWSSSDPSVVTVAGGYITAIAPGTATITATAYAGDNVKGTCTVTVADAPVPSFYSTEIVSGTDYYIYNAATGKFLGGGNSWGTQASLIEHGIPFGATKIEDGVYTLDSYTYNKADQHFLSGTYVDGVATDLHITSLGNGKFSIDSPVTTGEGENAVTNYGNFMTAGVASTVVTNNAKNSESTLAQWYFISKTDRDKMLAAANTENPVDATYYIKQANISRNLSAGGHNVNAWSQYSVEGSQDNTNFAGQVYNTGVDNYQTIANIPNGTYTVTVQAFTSGDVKFYANDQEVAVRANDSGVANCSGAAALFAQDRYPNTVTVTVTDRTMKIGFKGDCSGAKWLCYDKFEMVMTGYTANTGVSASIDKDEIQIGQTANISAETVPATASFNAITSYTSSDESIATVDANGVVTGVGVGKATITVTANEMENFSTTVDVTVKLVTPTSFELSETEVALDAENPSTTLTITTTPEGANDAATWVSSDETVATVVDGVVTGVSSGTATITATSVVDAEISAQATVTVAFPESAAPEEYYVNNGAARTLYTIGENLIKNGSFEYPDTYYGWNVGTGAAMSSAGFEVLTEDGNTYVKSKKGEGGNTATAIKQVWPIESGKTYMFSYKIKGNAGKSSWTATSLTNELGNEASMIEREFNVTTDWQVKTYTFTNTEGYAYLQFWARWYDASFDDFYLVEVTSDKTVGNVEYALDALPTANIGENAFQYSQAAIDAANALVQGVATVEDVENAYAALTTVNAPADGQLFNVILTYAGWTYDNKAMTYLANGRTDAGLYNIQYKEAANKNLAQAFTFTKVEGNNYKMSQIDADGLARYISTGVPYNGNASQIRTTTNAVDALVVTVIPTATEGVWNLKNTAANQFIGSQDAGVFTVNSHIDFQLVETTKPEITISTTAAGYGTTMLPFAVAELPEGVKVYTCDATNGDVLTLTPADAIEANKPYIIEGDWEAVLTGDAQGINLTTTEGLLTGVYAETAAPVGSFVLQKNNDKVGFYRVADGKQPTVGANRAYLTEAAGARAAYFFGEGVTNGINAIEALTEGNVGIFNAAGVQQPRLQKGLNIVKKADGTSFKVMVK